jgi:pilus assembly protein CpaE
VRDEVRCLVVGGDAAVAAAVVASIDAPGLRCSGALDPGAALAGPRPDCDVIVICDAPGRPALDLIEPLQSACPGVPIVMACRSHDLAMHRAALAAGARGLTGLPPDRAELALAVSNAAAAGEGRRRAAPAGRAVAVCGAKGGTGTSTTALELARSARGLLVDMASGFDDAAARLGCSPRRTLADLVPLRSELGADSIRSVASHHPDGMWLIAGPDVSDDLDLIPSALGSAIVRESRAVAPLSLFDLGVPRGELSAQVAAAADHVLVVTTPDRRSVGCAAVAAGWLDRRGVPAAAVSLVVNRWTRGGELSLRGIERATGIPLAAVIRERAGGEQLRRLASELAAA